MPANLSWRQQITPKELGSLCQDDKDSAMYGQEVHTPPSCVMYIARCKDYELTFLSQRGQRQET